MSGADAAPENTMRKTQFPQTDIIVTEHRAIVERPSTLLYFQLLGQQFGLAWAQIDVGREILELVDGTEFDGGDIAAIEETPEEGIPALLRKDLDGGAWEHLPVGSSEDDDE